MLVRQKSRVCDNCRLRKTRKQYVFVSVNGLKFRSFKDGTICCKCFRKKILKQINRLIEIGYFEIISSGVSINWDKCLEAYSQEGDSNYDWTRILLFLVDYGALTYTAIGNFKIENTGSQSFMCLGPMRLYFTSSSEADRCVAACKRRWSGDSFGFYSVFQS